MVKTFPQNADLKNRTKEINSKERKSINIKISYWWINDMDPAPIATTQYETD